MSAKKPAAVKPASKKTVRPAATHPTWVEMIKVRLLAFVVYLHSFVVCIGACLLVIGYGGGRAQGIFLSPTL